MSFKVETLRAVVHAGEKTSGDARSWYMISGDAKSWGNGRNDGQGGQGSKVNDGVDGVLDFSTIIAQQLRNLLPTIGDVRNVTENNHRMGCTYKEFLACNPKEYDGKGGREVAVGMSWDNFKILMGEEFCPSNEMQKLETKLWNHTMVMAGYAAYTDRFHELARLVPHLVTPKNRKIERNGSIKKNLENRGNEGEPSKDKNRRDDNKRIRTRNDFATTTNPLRREYMGTTPKCTACNYPHSPKTPCHTCFNCNRPRHFAKDCRVVPRNLNPINARNPTPRACHECSSTDHVMAACPRAFMLGTEEARQDPNIVTGIEPNDLGFSYKIEIASGQLVEIDKVIKGCKLEIKEELCLSNKMQKLETELWNHTMVEANHAVYTDRYDELDRLFPHLVTLEEPKTVQKIVLIAGTLTDEALRNESIKKNLEKRGNGGEPNKDRNVSEDNKRTRIGNAFAITTNPIRGGFIGSKDRGNHHNQVVAINRGQGHRNQRNQARGRALRLGAEEARQDSNIMT
nr:hypothetical protein [Tanacetum cinerariifolium]